MLFRTHALFSLLIGILVFSYFDMNVFLFLLLVVLGGMLPDIDKGSSKINNLLIITKPIALMTRHRGMFHSLFFAALIPGAFILYIDQTAGIALLIGYLGHLVIDGMNLAGINFIHPLQKLHIAGFIETGSWAEHMLAVVLGILFLVRINVLLF